MRNLASITCRRPSLANAASRRPLPMPMPMETVEGMPVWDAPSHAHVTPRTWLPPLDCRTFAGCLICLAAEQPTHATHPPPTLGNSSNLAAGHLTLPYLPRALPRPTYHARRRACLESRFFSGVGPPTLVPHHVDFVPQAQPPAICGWFLPCLNNSKKCFVCAAPGCVSSSLNIKAQAFPSPDPNLKPSIRSAQSTKRNYVELVPAQ